MEDLAPRILTATLDHAAQARFDALRSAHFPAHRLVIGAHLTLFHALPADLGLDAVAREASAGRTLALLVTGVRLLGRGVAFRLESQPLRQVRARLREVWLDRLTAQDRQPWQPHITIQNKVDPADARALRDGLAAAFKPFAVTATGLALWRYRNGPWQEAGSFPFGE
ncbi:2'-5' RNA ligase family protein [Rhodopila sp.]|uniref:2'-5' RNA ligase family protein n=1 Tax=Rhodopila sp. TaxID=2480087 RepID=UPI003D0DB1C1